MEFVLTTMAIALLASFALQARDRASERAAWDRRESALLDRLMARDLGDLKAYEARPQAPTPLTDAERRQQEDDTRVAELAGGLV